MARQRAPWHVIEIVLLGLILIMASMMTLFMTAGGGDYMAYAYVFTILGAVLLIVGGWRARKYVKPSESK